MSDAVVRLLRDGALAGESAPVVVVSDDITCNSGPRVLHHLVQSLGRAVTSGHAQAKGLVILALQNPPEVYHRSFQEITTLPSAAGVGPLPDWLHVIDCFSDPLGWNTNVSNHCQPPNHGLPHGTCAESDPTPPGASGAADDRLPAGNCGEPFRSLGDLDLLTSAVVHAAPGKSIGSEPKPRCCLVIDSLSVLLRHHPLPPLMAWIEAMTWQGVISSVLVLLHSDLHPPSALSSLHYLANATLALQPPHPSPPPPPPRGDRRAGGGGREEGERLGEVKFREKRRNGKVREVVEVFHLLPDGALRFSAPPTVVTTVVAPRVTSTKAEGAKTRQLSFNTEVSEREREERAKVVLPYEHQGEEGRGVRIYDGRKAVHNTFQDSRSQSDVMKQGGNMKYLGPLEGMESDVIVAKLQTLFSDNDEKDREEGGGSGEGHIHYLRNSDDEVPDSDEDLDDDLDI